MDSGTAYDRTFSLSQLPIVFDNPHRVAQDGSRRTSSASTASSMPRTPSSIAWDRYDDFSPLVDSQPFEADYGSESSSLIAISPDAPFKRDSLPVIVHQGPQRSGWNTVGDNPRRSHSIIHSSMEPQHHRLSRAATMHTVPGVRPLPMPPSTAHRLSPLQDQPEDDVDATEHSNGTDSDSPGESGDSANHLQRRRHIRRPTREKKDLPRPLPPLPASNLAHSQTTAGRFVTAPSGEEEPPFGDMRRRSQTLNVLSSGVRPLPAPHGHSKSQSSSSKPAPNKPGGKLVPVILPLKLHTLELRSSPSEAAGVLTKTPNRPSNHSALARSFMAPPMPADAANTIDWDLLDDALGIEDDVGP